MLNILIIESSVSLLKSMSAVISDKVSCNITTAKSIPEATSVITENHQFELLVTSASVFESNQPEMLKKIEALAIPSVLFTGIKDPQLRKDISNSTLIIDYVVKDSPFSLEYLVSIIQRFANNASIKALVVDDTKSSRLYLSSLLKNYNFQVEVAADGEEALLKLTSLGDVQLILVDYTMPGITGPELIQQLRERKHYRDTVIIGLTATEDANTVIDFIKYGANDYLRKPFLKEELFTRINRSLELYEKSIELRTLALKDFLTGAPNRRAFFSEAPKKLKHLTTMKALYGIVVFDLDHFKSVNDTYGHEAGDLVLKNAVKIIEAHIKDDELFARTGGEEFFALIEVNNTLEMENRLENLRKAIEKSVIEYKRQQIKVTVSIGAKYCGEITTHLMIDEFIEIADKAVYTSKSNGRNTVTIV